MDRYAAARQREKEYHDKLYREHSLYSPGSWLHKTIPYVVESFAYIQNREGARALDLGSGVGRHSIPLAQYLGLQGTVTCVDILDSAIEILARNARQYSVEEKISSFVSDVEEFSLEGDLFDYILSVSCIEHVSTRQKFIDLIKKLQSATRINGVHCFCIITDNTWIEKDTAMAKEPLIELNLESEDVKSILRELYKDWDVKDISEKPWQTSEILEEKNMILKSNCLQFIAVKRRLVIPSEEMNLLESSSAQGDVSPSTLLRVDMTRG